MNNITKAIIPVAGYGTRRLPITKAIEKCMLPIGNRPIVDYVVEDCIKAGITDIIFVVGEQFDQLQSFYGRNQLLEEYLRDKGKASQLDDVVALAEKARFHYVVQDQHQPYGTAVPVSLCAHLIGKDERALVLMGDDFIYRQDGQSEAKNLIAGVEASDASVGLLAATVPREEVSKYGVIEMEQKGDVNYFKHIVEKPSVGSAPSTLINISKYLFNYDLMQCAREVMKQPLTPNGEYQLIEALNMYVDAGNPVAVVPAGGEFMDGGTVEGWLAANNRVLAKSKL
ncbi:MAG TPA: sugar phosphate nucleotidyltransferase [Candidatus Saccharimonadales bacterium]|nr:sugar phosphate nucleotidyltransferase [Candidatus Saccharimonadales bacterium]